MRNKILLLSGYDAASHQYWRQLLENHMPEYQWTQVAMPDRHFYWRVRGNSLGFAYNYKEVLEKSYDLLITTSMVDLSSLRGFCPTLANTPTLVYFHENQFAYPVSNAKPNLVNVQLTSIYNALCADKILFNSNFNRLTFYKGAAELLKRFPDEVPKDLVEKLQPLSDVIPVPIELVSSDNKIEKKSIDFPVQIVWNHRWEYDKQPDVFFNAMKQLKQEGVSFKLHILGQSFRNQPECFTEAEQSLSDEIQTFGYQDRDDYLNILSSADMVVSSSLHDFQGLSLQEGIALGCMPIAPNRVAYPEYIPEQLLYETAENPELEASNLCSKIQECITLRERLVPDVQDYSANSLIPKYKDCFQQLHR
ncbi:MAG: DUF3524 domain-containing protein [Gammaproteobacteria bacterium]|nr:DUF3524 domain-containing protein [Gammaproteobacteria bacterium]